jgi:phage terminase small subunit
LPCLSNPKHERFAQGLAKGKTADEAYQEAGYKPNRHNAATLARQQHISTRLTELQERGAIRAEITVADLILELEEARKAAVSADNPQSSAMVAATMGKAKLLGFITDKVKADVNVSHEDALDALR